MLGYPLFRKKRKRNTKEIEPHEVFLDNLAQKKEEEFGTSKKRLEVSLSTKSLSFFSLSIFLLFMILFGRSFQLQLVDGDYFSSLAQNNISSISKTQLLRGIIYDRNYNQLTFNSPQHDLYFQGKEVTREEVRSVEEIAEIIGKESQEIINKIENSNTPRVLIEANLDHEKLVMLQAELKEIDNFKISKTAGRKYLFGESLAHVLGYIGKIDQDMLKNNPGKYTIHDYVGKMGVERSYESYLTRVGETTEFERDVSGNIISERKTDSSDKGENIVLTIDADLQEIVMEKTQEKLEEIEAEKAGVVILDPQNGDILSMVSLPSFDNNLFRKSTDSEVFNELFANGNGVFVNRIISATYPTGSVIKPILAVAALEEGLITPEKQINSLGYISIPNPWNPSQPTIFRDFHVHGWRDMREAIAVSSNVYFYAIGGGYEDQKGLGAKKIKKYLSLFGWEDKTGVDLPGEKSGIIPSAQWKQQNLNDIWRIGDTYNLSIGQGYLRTTPLQVANSFTALVNGGKLFNPRIVKKIVDDDSNLVKENKKSIIREDFVSLENLKIVKEGMKMATEIGTARSLQALPVTSGAKTGTAQTSRSGINNNWVTAFAPYDNPKIVITVIIEDVEGVTPVATHLARDILMEYFKEAEEEKK